MAVQRKLIIAGAVLGALSVGIGAFGAHALKPVLIENNRLETFELAVRYQFYHTMAILILAALAEKLDQSKSGWAGVLFTSGIIIFSGSLYILSLTGKTIWGAVTPFGGACLISGWIMTLLAVKRSAG